MAKNAWLDNPCTIAHFKFFDTCDEYGEGGLIEEFRNESDHEWEEGPFILIQQDNLVDQNEDNVKQTRFRK